MEENSVTATLRRKTCYVITVVSLVTVKPNESWKQMARYVLVAFDDNEDAEQFLLNFEASSENYGYKGTIRSVYAKPTIYCDCSVQGKRGEGGFTRGKKYGWWVHSSCGKPTKAWADGHDWFVHLGVNLIPKSAEAPEYRGDGNWAPSQIRQEAQ